MTSEHVEVRYGVYWKAWFVLLLVTFLMVYIPQRELLVGGMLLKASIIVLWFMHLRYERLDFTLTVILSILLTGLLLFFMIAPDGKAA